MTYRQDKQRQIVPPEPVKKFIPYGQFTAIDEKYYNPVEVQPASDVFSRGRTLKPHGSNVNHKSDGFVQQSPSLALDGDSLRVNYGSYIYQQQTGYDAAHPRDERPQDAVIFV